MKINITPDGYFLMLLVLEIISHNAFPVLKIIFFPYNLIGIVLIIIGIVMTLSANLLLLKNNTSIRPYETPRIIVTSGLFRFSRNPIYLGMAAILFGAAILLGTQSPFVFPATFIIVIDRLVIPTEEKDLEKKFGKSYLDYKKKVRRWI